jgi:eukaryotic-like serine/threonine-protein kinase
MTGPAKRGPIRALFDAALERAPDERAAFLRAHSTDDEVLREVTSLLAAHDDAGALLEVATGPAVVAQQQMSLAPGSRIGPYAIRTPLGTGGMGIVYRARDERLHRDVAVKILKSGDEDTGRRFLREAQTASALNHPNIVTIYDIGTAEGCGPYLAMEYIEGTTLRDLLSGGRLDTATVLRYSLQLALALSRAHAASIVHRDLKPANVMVTEEGTLKVLDFGLAKPLQMMAGGSAPTALTMSGPMAIVGSIPYMSPEQARGDPVDQRSDVFSFGVVLHEMATGTHPFERESPIATLSAILQSDVKFAERSGSRPERAIEAIISRSLVKDRDRRYQTMEEVKRDLEEAQRLLAPSPTRAWGAPLLAATAIILAGVIIWQLSPSRPVSQPLLVPAPVTAYEGDETQPSLSPEGDRVAFSWNGEKQDNFDIYAKLLDSGPPLRLTRDAAEDSSPAWSPDGRSIAFLRGTAEQAGGVFVLPALGGPERKLTDVRVPPAFFPGHALAWSPDGQWLVCGCGQKGTLILISADTGAQRALAPVGEFPGSKADVNPSFSSDGAQLAFARFLGGPGEIFVLPLNEDYTARGAARQLTFDKRIAFGPTWLAGDADLLFVAGPSHSELRLWRIAVAGKSQATPLGSLGDRVGNPTAVQPRGGSGTRLVYERRTFDTNIWRLELSGLRTPIRLASSSADDNDPKLSPDGKQLLFASNRSGRHDLWVSDADGSQARQLLRNGGEGGRWSADGAEIVYESPQTGRHIAIVKRDGTGRRQLTAVRDGVVPSFSRDGKWIYFASDQATPDVPQVWKVRHPERGSGPSVPIQLTKGGGTYSEESLDGRYVYYARSFGLGQIWRVPSGGGKEELVIDGGVHWSNFVVVSDGIYYIAIPPAVYAASSQLYGAAGNALRFFRFADRRTLTLQTLPRPVYMGLSVSPDRASVFLTQVDHQGSDLLTVQGIQ